MQWWCQGPCLPALCSHNNPVKSVLQPHYADEETETIVWPVVGSLRQGAVMPHLPDPFPLPQVRAGESLMKLVSDLKQFLILNDFPSVNEAIDQRNQQLRALQEECDRKLITLRDEISIDLYELEEEYYSSRYK